MMRSSIALWAFILLASPASSQQAPNYNANYCSHVQRVAATLGMAYFRQGVPTRSLHRRLMDLRGVDQIEVARSRGAQIPYPYDIQAISEGEWLRTEFPVVPRVFAIEIGSSLDGRERAEDTSGQILQYQAFANEWFDECMTRRAAGRWH